MAEHIETRESAIGTIVGWGLLATFAVAFGMIVYHSVIGGEQWSEKKTDAIDLVRNSKPSGSNVSIYDLTREYAQRARERDLYVGEFSWDAIQREGPEYEVTLLWKEGSERRVALWRVNLKTHDIRPQGNEAASLAQHMAAPAAAS